MHCGGLVAGQNYLLFARTWNLFCANNTREMILNAVSLSHIHFQIKPNKINTCSTLQYKWLRLFNWKPHLEGHTIFAISGIRWTSNNLIVKQNKNMFTQTQPNLTEESTCQWLNKGSLPLGFMLYVLWRDISSCMGSKITQS